MGEWLIPDPPAVLLADVLDSPAFDIPPQRRNALAVALGETGFVVSTPYYVPDADELFGMYHQLAEVEYYGRGSMRRSWIRWVMCGETQLALYRKYSQTRAVHTPNLSAFLAGNEEPGTAVVDELHMVMTMRAAASIPTAIYTGRLFDMPIRRDPAARRPLFELIPESERGTD